MSLRLLVCFIAAGLHAQPGATVELPFVGCPAGGQTGNYQAPPSRRVALPVAAPAARQLAYYGHRAALSVLAPRGWRCFEVHGSSGMSVLVTPDSRDPDSFFRKAESGPAILRSLELGAGSGRFRVAEVIARVFPSRRAFVENLIRSFDAPASQFTFGPHSDDRLTYRGPNVVEYLTPPRREGLGTGYWVAANDSPISGVAMLRGSAPDLVFLAARLPAAQAGLIPVIIRQVKLDAERSVP